MDAETIIMTPLWIRLEKNSVKSLDGTLKEHTLEEERFGLGFNGQNSAHKSPS